MYSLQRKLVHSFILYVISLLSSAVRQSVRKPFSCSMAGGMLRNSSPASTAPCKSGEVPFVVTYGLVPLG